MKLFVTGGTGFVGRYVTRGLAQMGHDVTVVTRSSKKDRESPGGISLVEGDPTKPGLWQERVAEHDVIINLAGAPIFTHWTRKAKQNILESRLPTTHNLVDALAESKKESLLLSTSAVGYYGGHMDDEMLDESSPAGDDFLAQVGLGGLHRGAGEEGGSELVEVPVLVDQRDLGLGLVLS